MKIKVEIKILYKPKGEGLRAHSSPWKNNGGELKTTDSPSTLSASSL